MLEFGAKSIKLHLGKAAAITLLTSESYNRTAIIIKTCLKMKCAKKSADKNGKSANDTSTPVIKNFFKIAPKSFVVSDGPKNNHDETSSRDFYIQTLKEIIQGNLR